VAAGKVTGRKNLIMAGVTVEVCLAYPAMQAAGEGFNVYGVIDASGAPDAATPEMTVHRLVVRGSCSMATIKNWVVLSREIKEITVKPFFKGDRTWHRKQR
jgi:hypothetical protein